MKRFLSVILAIVFCCSSVATSLAASPQIDDVVTTAYILVENGVARQISLDEYEQLISTPTYHEVVDMSDNEAAVPATIVSTFYIFENTSETTGFHPELETRVSPIFSNAVSLSVSSSYTFTRTVTESKGLSITRDITSALDAKAAYTYSRSVSSASATGTSITGTMAPTGRYTYSCVTFIPRLATITGTVSHYQSLEGFVMLISSTSGVQVRYPVTVGNYLDGIYQVRESNNYNSL